MAIWIIANKAVENQSKSDSRSRIRIKIHLPGLEYERKYIGLV